MCWNIEDSFVKLYNQSRYSNPINSYQFTPKHKYFVSYFPQWYCSKNFAKFKYRTIALLPDISQNNCNMTHITFQACVKSHSLHTDSFFIACLLIVDNFLDLNFILRFQNKEQFLLIMKSETYNLYHRNHAWVPKEPYL